MNDSVSHKTMKSTPGPWRVGEMSGGTINIEAFSPPRHITVGRVHVFNTSQEPEANARLIAAAPDLLALLVELKASHYGAAVREEYENRVEAAIAKATGGAQ